MRRLGALLGVGAFGSVLDGLGVSCFELRGLRFGGSWGSLGARREEKRFGHLGAIFSVLGRSWGGPGGNAGGSGGVRGVAGGVLGRSGAVRGCLGAILEGILRQDDFLLILGTIF